MKIPHSRPILLSFGLASTALVMCALLLLEWRDGTAAVDSFEWVSHTLEVQRELATVEARMSEAESGQRGYLLTGQPGFLAPYSAATNEIRTRLLNLRRLLADNPVLVLKKDKRAGATPRALRKLSTINCAKTEVSL